MVEEAEPQPAVEAVLTAVVLPAALAADIVPEDRFRTDLRAVRRGVRAFTLPLLTSPTEATCIPEFRNQVRRKSTAFFTPCFMRPKSTNRKA